MACTVVTNMVEHIYLYNMVFYLFSIFEPAAAALAPILSSLVNKTELSRHVIAFT